MPRPKSDTRARIIASARTLLRRHGYHGTGLTQIIEHSGAPRGSVYFLFPGGKEEIAVAAVDDWAVEVDRLIHDRLADSTSARGWATSLVEHFARDLRDSDFTEGLPVTTITLDSVPASPALSKACRAAYDTWLTSVTHGLVSFGAPARGASGLAALMLATLEGAAVLCRAYRTTGPLDQVAPYVLKQLPG
ncbi:TetR/AcrR family transcriptional regulator [Krasilnikovia sp. M28-CT-15]|uniref:TetR/AcrR family transcriptional regulator n=1 Tax=Krasilnikovia sp. M28-CT-15 TaxID=3373540 RepID=UPI003875CEAA